MKGSQFFLPRRSHLITWLLSSHARCSSDSRNTMSRSSVLCSLATPSMRHVPGGMFLQVCGHLYKVHVNPGPFISARFVNKPEVLV